jgi:hypothetical protein
MAISGAAKRRVTSKQTIYQRVISAAQAAKHKEAQQRAIEEAKNIVGG